MYPRGTYSIIHVVQYVYCTCNIYVPQWHVYCTCIYHSQNWLRGPHSGGEPAGGNKIGDPVDSVDTNLISIAVLQWGTHLWACKTHEMREVGLSDGIGICVLYMQYVSQGYVHIIHVKCMSCIIDRS